MCAGTPCRCLALTIPQDFLDEAIEYIGQVDFSESKTSSHVRSVPSRSTSTLYHYLILPTACLRQRFDTLVDCLVYTNSEATETIAFSKRHKKLLINLLLHGSAYVFLPCLLSPSLIRLQDNDLPFGWIDFSNNKPDVATVNKIVVSLRTFLISCPVVKHC